MSHLDPLTIQCDKEVQRITHLQKITGQLPDAFTDTTKVTKSYISVANTPTKEEQREIIWNASSMSHLDSRTIQCDKEVQRITHLQKIASQLSDAFTDTIKVTKSYIQAANTPSRINIVTPQTRGSVDYPSTRGIQVEVGLPDATLENRTESPLYRELYPNTKPAYPVPNSPIYAIYIQYDHLDP